MCKALLLPRDVRRLLQSHTPPKGQGVLWRQWHRVAHLEGHQDAPPLLLRLLLPHADALSSRRSVILVLWWNQRGPDSTGQESPVCPILPWDSCCHGSDNPGVVGLSDRK